MPSVFYVKLEHVQEALRRADLDPETRDRIGAELISLRFLERKAGGRPEEDDSEAVNLALSLMDQGMSRWGAAGFVTEGPPEHRRETDQRRIYRKLPKRK